jgi:serine/threonine-protein kinase
MGELDEFEDLRKRVLDDSERAKHHVEPGMTLKHYSLEEKIGEGKVANIFSARNIITGERVSIKAVKARWYVNDKRERHIARFRREVAILLNYHHPNVVRIKDYGEDKTLFYVMDPIDGKDLFELLKDYREQKKHFGEKRAVIMTKKIASALHGMHEMGVLHRDLKPENIMVNHPDTEEEDYILIDLGYGKVEKASLELTGTHDLLGTLEFMAPEYLAGRPYDVRCDVYSLSKIFYEALAGRAPFIQGEISREEDTDDFIRRIKNAEIPPVTRFNLNVHPEVNVIVMRGVKKDPDDRYQTCNDLVIALEEVKRLAA